MINKNIKWVLKENKIDQFTGLLHVDYYFLTF